MLREFKFKETEEKQTHIEKIEDIISDAIDQNIKSRITNQRNEF